jgi:hypothetical protein
MLRPLLYVGAILLASVALHGCGADLCGNDNVRATASPDGTLTALVFRRDCGATTGFSTHISIVRSGTALSNDPGNVLTVAGEPPVTVTWQGPTRLVVANVGDKVFRRADRVGGISIDYR